MREEQLAQQQRAAKMVEVAVGIVEPGADIAQILGHVIAHELGRLLGLDSHSPTGLMRADWNLTDLRNATHSYLLFTAQQAEGIRAEVRRRTTQQDGGSMTLDVGDKRDSLTFTLVPNEQQPAGIPSHSQPPPVLR